MFNSKQWATCNNKHSNAIVQFIYLLKYLHLLYLLYYKVISSRTLSAVLKLHVTIDDFYDCI